MKYKLIKSGWVKRSAEEEPGFLDSLYSPAETQPDGWWVKVSSENPLLVVLGNWDDETGKRGKDWIIPMNLRDVEIKNFKSNNIIVTRHKSLAEFLINSGVIPFDLDIKEHVSVDDVKNKSVFGVLPLHLACECESVTEVSLDIPAEYRGKELSLDDINKFFIGINKYSVRKIK